MKRFQNIQISKILNGITALIFLIACILFWVLLKYNMQKLAIEEASSKAKILLDRDLAIHHYFSSLLKPRLFEWSEPFREKEYFDPVWMSSTYAVRKIDDFFQILNQTHYYYKECAINARSPQNEADEYEKEFLQNLAKDPSLMEHSIIRELEEKPYFVFMRRGELMESSCLRCHSEPELAPLQMVLQYGEERSFHRKEGETVSAISIRVPLSEAYSNTNRLTLYLFLVFSLFLLVIFLIHSFLYRKLVFKPLAEIREKAKQIASNRNSLGDEIAMSPIPELHDLTLSFNEMSHNLRDSMDHLEDRVQQRTTDLSQLNQKLQEEILVRRTIEREKETLIQELQEALTKVQMLSGFLPICSSCKKIRDDKGYWNQIETYISEHTSAEFSHSICPECAIKLYPQYYKDDVIDPNQSSA